MAKSEKEQEIDRRVAAAGIDPELQKATAAPANPLTEAAGPVLKSAPGNPEMHEAIKDRKDDHPTVEVEFIQGYFPADGGSKIAKGSRKRLQIEDARYLVESNIAVLTDQFEGR